MAQRRTRRTRLAMAALLSVSSFVALVPNAVADTFFALPDAPTLQVIATPNNMQPAHPNSDAVYTATVAVGSQGSVSNITNVYMCWTKLNDGGGSATNATCFDGNWDARHEFEMQWTNWDYYEGDNPEWADDWFDVYGGDFYANASSVSGYGDGTAGSMNMSFKFKVSEGMLKGNDWSMTIKVVDSEDQSVSETITDKSVLYFGAVASLPNQQNFGDVAGEDYSIREGSWDGAFIANAVSDLSYSIDPFVYDNGVDAPSVLPLDGGNPGDMAGAGKVAVDCVTNYSWYTNSGEFRMTEAPQTARTGEFMYGTGEYGDDPEFFHACALYFGGGAPVANETYYNTFTVGIGE